MVSVWIMGLALLGGMAPVRADVVTDWNEQAFATLQAAKQSPFMQARSLALVHGAMFEAVNAIQKHYTPYKISLLAGATASSEAAAAAAAHTLLVKLYPDQQVALDKAYNVSLSPLPGGEGKAAGIALGEKVASMLFTLRAEDGINAPNTYKPFTAPGVYVPTALPVGTEQPRVAPWLMDRSAQFRPSPPPALTSQEWARDYNEVKDWGGKNSNKRTLEQTNIARFWVVMWPASWYPILQQLTNTKSRSLVKNARFFALVTMVAADALIAVMDAKYAYNLWRPITAIRNGESDGNTATSPDLTWMPLIDTPLHPEYPCAHCILAGAVVVLLEAEFGTDKVTPVTMTSPTAPDLTRRWEHIQDIAVEISNARVWGGIHYRTSTQVGETMGKKIGEYALKTYLKPM
jgi:hypothetical protein